MAEILMSTSGPARRICSLLPSATEIVCALGLADRLVGVTHECDYPPEIVHIPKITASVIDSGALSSREIDTAVRDSLEEQETIYRLNAELLDELHPDLILTQRLCAVCAVGPDEVEGVIRSLSSPPAVASLEPTTLSEVLDTILTVGRLTGTLRRAIALTEALRARLERVRDAVSGEPRVRVLTMEWTEPLFVGGHWVPEMAALAGGEDVLGLAGKPSREVDWGDVAVARPEVIVAMPCGFDLPRSCQEMLNASFPDVWADLPAVRAGRVFAVDGSAYFSRPGPRLVDGVEILAAILHPTRFAAPRSGLFHNVEGIRKQTTPEKTAAR